MQIDFSKIFNYSPEKLPDLIYIINNPIPLGVHSVDAKFEKGEITVKGAVDAKKIHARLQKWSKKKVELISETKSKEEVKKVKQLFIYHFLQLN